MIDKVGEQSASLELPATDNSEHHLEIRRGIWFFQTSSTCPTFSASWLLPILIPLLPIRENPLPTLVLATSNRYLLHHPPRQILSMATNPSLVFAGASSHICSHVLNTRPRRHIRSKSFPTSLPTLFTVPNCILRSLMPLWFSFSDSKLVFQPQEGRLATDYLSLRL